MASGILRAGKYTSKLSGPRVSPGVPGLTEPLVPKPKRSRWSAAGLDSDDSFSSDSESGSPEDDADYGEEEDSFASEELLQASMTGKEIVKTLGVALLVTSGMAASASAIITAQAAVVILMGGICIANAPTVAIRHLTITRNAGVRTIINDIREEIGLLESEIDFLTDSVDDLQAEADVLVGLEGSLQDIAKAQGTNVEEIVGLVNENEEILSHMKSNLTQTFVTAMARVVMRSDTDNDMKIDKKETPLLALRLQIQLEPYGIKLDTKKFEEMVREDNDISHILKFCATLLFADEESNQDNSDDNSSVDSDVTFDFEAFCKNLDEDEAVKMSQAEKASMATVDDKYSHGSVEVARGKRMTLMPSASKKDLRRKTIIKEVKKRQTLLKARRATKFAKKTNSPRNTLLSFGSGHVIVRGTSAEF